MLRLVAFVLLLGSVFADVTAAQPWVAFADATTEDSVVQLTSAVFSLSNTGVLLNELRSPGQRATQRVQQLASIAADVQEASKSCGVYTFSPGGAAANAKWTGPTFTLTQSTGSCIVKPAFRGDGNTRWTRLQTTLACLGPSTQWSWAPLTYEGPSREPTTLEGPNCKVSYRFGSETSAKISGQNGKTTFASEKAFYASAVADAIFGVRMDLVKAALAELGAGTANTLLDGLLGHTAGATWREQLSNTAIAMTPDGSTKGPFVKLATDGITRTRGLGSRAMFRFRSL